MMRCFTYSLEIPIVQQKAYRMWCPILLENLKPLTPLPDTETCVGSSREHFTSRNSSSPIDGIGASSTSSVLPF